MPQYSNDITITFPGGTPLVACPNNVRATSDAINNTVTQFDEVEIEVQIKLGASGVGGGTFTLAFFGSDDGGLTYDNYIDSVNTLLVVNKGQTNGNTLRCRAVIHVVPQFWKFAVLNSTGAAFDSTGANFFCVFTGIINKSNITLSATQTNVTTSATLLVSADKNRNGMLVVNKGSDIIYVGGSGVTISTGFPVEVDQVLDLDNLANNALYGIVPSVTSLASVLQW